MLRRARQVWGPLIVCCGLAGALAAGTLKVATFQPDPDEPGAPRLDGETWLVETEGFELRLRHLDGDERRAFIRRAAGTEIDPYAVADESGPAYETFMLLVDNRSDGTLAFHTQNAWLMTNRKQVLTPVGIDDLRTSYRMAGQEFPEAFERVRPALLAGSYSLEPGGAAAGLIVFRQLERRTRSYRVVLSLVLPDGDVVELFAPYRRVKAAR